MTKAKAKKPKKKALEPQAAPEEEAPGGEPREENAEAPDDEPREEDAGEAAPVEESVEERAARLEAEVADLKDKLLRALAEAENVRRRAERDRIDASKYAIANFAREMLAVADNLRRALDSVEDKDRQKNPIIDNLVVGVEMTEREMLNVFERNAIKQIEAMGKKFDHNLHEAMFEFEDPDKPAGTVFQVLQTGYVLNDRLLRPAKVGISKGGPKEAPQADKPAAEEAAPEPAAKGPAEAYEKQTETTGSKLDEEL